MAHATVYIRRGTPSGFALHLLNLAGPEDILSVRELVRQALQSPFGRHSFDILRPPAEVAGLNPQVIQAITECLFQDNVTSARNVRLWQVGVELPYMVVEPPLAAFSSPCPSCILHIMSLASLRYPGMDKDLRAFVLMELHTEPPSVTLNQLTEHGRWLFDELAIIEMVPQGHWLKAFAAVFDRFVARIEQVLARRRMFA